MISVRFESLRTDWTCSHFCRDANADASGSDASLMCLIAMSPEPHKRLIVWTESSRVHQLPVPRRELCSMGRVYDIWL